MVQRACKTGVPKTPGCVPDPNIAPPTTRFLFRVNCDDFEVPGSPPFVSEEARMDAFARAITPPATVRIVGLASFDGPADLNKRLACSRAERGQVVIKRSAPAGVTISSVQATVGGPATAHDAKMRAVGVDVSRPAPPPPKPKSPCPAVPTTTPATCADRHKGYCDAAACFPTNKWLGCVCTVSGQICDAIDAFELHLSTTPGKELAACLAGSSVFNPLTTPPPGPIVAKGKWFETVNQCIWGHWRAALDAIHDPALPLPTGATPEWAAAITTCRVKGLSSSDCCRAHVNAEQTAIDHCLPYPSSLFGKLPTDVPGSSTCSFVVGKFAPGPPFSGDFGLVSDRIPFGLKVCGC